MNWSERVRQTHRWLSITFTVLVIVNIILNFVAVGPEQLALWVGMFTLLPLGLLMLTGLYLFVARRGPAEPKLLSAGNPQIAKAYGEA